MGRKSLNRTYEEMLELQRLTANEYYKNNKDSVNERRRAKYQQLKKTGIKNKIRTP